MGDQVHDVELHPGETLPLQANFEDVLAEGEDVLDATVVAYDSLGDAAPAGLFDGARIIVSPRVQQRITMGTGVELGESYLVVITAQTSQGLDYAQRFRVTTAPLVEPVPAIDATVGGRNANSYVTLDEAETYMRARLRAGAWEAATRTDRVRALLQAARDLEAIPYKGDRYEVGFDVLEPTKPVQALAFPRNYTSDGNGAAMVPQEVLDAQCEQALWLLQGAASGAERRLQLQAQGVASFAVEGMSETFRQTGGTWHPWQRLCPDAQRLLARHADFAARLERSSTGGLFDLRTLRPR